MPDLPAGHRGSLFNVIGDETIANHVVKRDAKLFVAHRDLVIEAGHVVGTARVIGRVSGVIGCVRGSETGSPAG